MTLTRTKAKKIIDCIYQHLLMHNEELGKGNWKGIYRSTIKEYLEPIDPKKNMQHIFRGYVYTLENRAVMSDVIQLENRNLKFLFNFDYFKIYDTYKDDVKKFLKAAKKCNRDIQINRRGNSLWNQFAKGVLDGAKFFLQFKKPKDFKNFVAPFYKQKTEGAILLAQTLGSGNLSGMRFRLAMDFLKNSGTPISKYCVKPDVHINDFVQRIKILRNGHNKRMKDEDVVRAIRKMAELTNLTNYQIDKLFWLAGSGNFYDDPQIGSLWAKNQCPQKRTKLIKKINAVTC